MQYIIPLVTLSSKGVQNTTNNEYRYCKRCKRTLLNNGDYFYTIRGETRGSCKECCGYRFSFKKNVKEGYKICSKCKRELPCTPNYFFKRLSNKDGLNHMCKVCMGASGYSKDIPDAKWGFKICRDCFSELPATNEYFSKDCGSKDGLKLLCKKCVRTYYLNNKQRMKECQKKYRENNKEMVMVYQKIIAQKRRAEKNGLPNSYNRTEWVKTKKHFNNKCAYCGKEAKLTQDHFVPLSKGGEYTINNIVPACKSCNSSKNNRDFFEWYNGQPYYSKQRERKVLNYLNYNTKSKIQQLALIF